MSKEVRVVYEDFKVKYKIVPYKVEIKPKYKRAKKKVEDIKLTRDYIGKRDEDYER